MANQRAFRMHSNLLYSTIMAQAGTIAKAFMEAVQNSIDANATHVDLTLEDGRFSIADDGRGFQTLTEIEEYFEQFGTPHVEGDARYGRFRMGRGQLFAFGRNTWRSQSFAMHVDVKEKGLAYDLEDDQPVLSGCRVDVDLYDRLSLSERMDIVQQVKELVRFSEIPVTLNGEVISQSPSTLKGFTETPEAYFRLNETGSLKVYNMGMFVREYPRHTFGLGGTVISKTALQVNFARNDILLSQCAVWKKISRYLKEQGGIEVAKKSRSGLTDDERLFVIKGLLANPNPSRDDLLSIKRFGLLPLANGKKMSLDTYSKSNHGIYSAPGTDKDSRFAESRLAERLARDGHIIFHPNIANEWNTTIDHLGDILDPYARRIRYLPAVPKEKSDTLKRYVPFSEMSKNYNTDYREVDPKILTKGERYIFQLLKKVSPQITYALRLAGKKDYLDKSTRLRDLYVGESDAALAWTDGCERIYVHRGLLKSAARNPHTIPSLIQIIAHEYLHDEPDQKGHSHTLEFYERFHDALVYSKHDNLNIVGLKTLALYGEYLQAEGKSLGSVNKRKLFDTLDLLSQDTEKDLSREGLSPNEEEISEENEGEDEGMRPG